MSKRGSSSSSSGGGGGGGGGGSAKSESKTKLNGGSGGSASAGPSTPKLSARGTTAASLDGDETPRTKRKSAAMAAASMMAVNTKGVKSLGRKLREFLEKQQDSPRAKKIEKFMPVYALIWTFFTVAVTIAGSIVWQRVQEQNKDNAPTWWFVVDALWFAWNVAELATRIGLLKAAFFFSLKTNSGHDGDAGADADAADTDADGEEEVAPKGKLARLWTTINQFAVLRMLNIYEVIIVVVTGIAGAASNGVFYLLLNFRLFAFIVKIPGFTEILSALREAQGRLLVTLGPLFALIWGFAVRTYRRAPVRAHLVLLLWMTCLPRVLTYFFVRYPCNCYTGMFIVTVL